MPLESPVQEPLGGRQIAPLTEPELNGVTVAVDRLVQIPPLPADLDIGFVGMPPTSDRSLAVIEPPQQQRRVMDSLAMDCSMINGDAALRHHLFQIPEAEIVSQVPPHAEQDD